MEISWPSPVVAAVRLVEASPPFPPPAPPAEPPWPPLPPRLSPCKLALPLPELMLAADVADPPKPPANRILLAPNPAVARMVTSRVELLVDGRLSVELAFPALPPRRAETPDPPIASCCKINVPLV